jgi:preprotein translocase subunit SecE
MASIKESDGKKWINATVILGSVLFAFICHAFILQLGDWLDLESKINQFVVVRQGAAILIGLAFWFAITKSSKPRIFLDEVYGELIKVVWPNKDSVVKMALGIMVGVSIFSSIMVLVDLGIQKLLGLIY